MSRLSNTARRKVRLYKRAYPLVAFDPEALRFFVHDEILVDVNAMKRWVAKELPKLTHSMPVDFEAGVDWAMPVDFEAGVDWAKRFG